MGMDSTKTPADMDATANQESSAAHENSETTQLSSLQSPKPPQRPSLIRPPGSGLSLNLSFSSCGSGHGSRHNQDDPQLDEFLFDHICADFEEIMPEDLYQSISRRLGVQYLSEASHVPVPLPIIQGATIGASMRPFVSMVVQKDQRMEVAVSGRNPGSPFPTLDGHGNPGEIPPLPRNVHFLYMAACPQTYLSIQTLKALGIDDQEMVELGLVNDDDCAMDDPIPIPLLINGYPVLAYVSPPESHFAHLNIIGQSLLRASGASVTMTGNPPVLVFTFPASHDKYM
ncbi:hypothetical protein BGW42_007157 [Actinomortierella wolfii]|nr:hypothetical protein BGW42_007157 [Actinomortierella wolfii]